MATVINKITLKVHRSVHTPNYSIGDYLINPDGLSALETGNIPVKYWKLNAESDDIEEMSQAEKDVVDAADLPAYKENAYSQIHTHKNSLISQGFVHSTSIFALSTEDRETWMGMKQGVDAGIITLPQTVGTLDNDEYIITDATDFTYFYIAALGTVKVRKESAQQARKSVFDAVDQAAVDIIINTYLATE